MHQAPATCTCTVPLYCTVYLVDSYRVYAADGVGRCHRGQLVDWMRGHGETRTEMCPVSWQSENETHQLMYRVRGLAGKAGVMCSGHYLAHSKPTTHLTSFLLLERKRWQWNFFTPPSLLVPVKAKWLGSFLPYRVCTHTQAAWWPSVI